MPSSVAAILCVLGIMVLFWLDREQKVHTSKALWIPVVWLWIVGSREVSLWMTAFGIWRSSGNVDPSLDGNPIDRVIYTGLLVLGLIVLAGRGAQVKSLLKHNIPIVLFFAYCAVSVCWSDYPGVAFKRWIKAIGDLVMVMIVLTDVDKLAAIKRLLARASFLLLPLSVLLIKYYPELGKSFKHYGTAIYFGVTTNKNLLGIICLLFGLASVWRFLLAYRDRGNARRKRLLIAHATVFGSVLWLLSMARSMTGLACLLLITPLIVAAGSRIVLRNRWLVHLLIVTVVSLAGSVLFLGVGTGSLEAMGKDPTLTGRTEIWDLVLSISGNPLVGTGFESFWLPGWRRDKIWDMYWWHPNEAHNGYIEMYLNLGWVGIALLAMIMVIGYRNVIGALRRDPDVAGISLAFFVVAVIYNFTEAGFRMLDPVWITFLIGVMAVSPSRVRQDSPSPGADNAEKLSAGAELHAGSSVYSDRFQREETPFRRQATRAWLYTGELGHQHQGL